MKEYSWNDKNLPNDIKERIKAVKEMPGFNKCTDINFYIYQEGNYFAIGHPAIPTRKNLMTVTPFTKKERQKMRNYDIRQNERDALKHTDIYIEKIYSAFPVLQEFVSIQLTGTQPTKQTIQFTPKNSKEYTFQVSKANLIWKENYINSYFSDHFRCQFTKGFFNRASEVINAINANRINEIRKIGYNTVFYEEIKSILSDYIPDKIVYTIPNDIGCEMSALIHIESDKLYFDINDYLRYDFVTASFQQIKEFYPKEELQQLYEKVSPAIMHIRQKFDALKKSLNMPSDIQLSLHSKKNDMSIKVNYERCNGFCYTKTITYSNIKNAYKQKNTQMINEMKQKYIDYQKEIAEKKKQKKLKEEQKKMDFWKKFQTSNCYGSLLAQDILYLIQKNKEFITANAVVASLRGTKVSVNPFQPIEHSKKYNAFSEAEIKGVINSLIQLKTVKEVARKNDFLDYYILKSDDYIVAELEKAKESYAPRKNKDMAKFTSWDWEYMLNHLDVYVFDTLAQWQKLLLIFESKDVMCIYLPEVISLFENSPEEIKTYIKIRAKIGKQLNNKYYKLVAAEIK